MKKQKTGIRQFRDRLKLSQEEFAALLDIHRTQLSQIENNTRELKMNSGIKIMQLVKALGNNSEPKHFKISRPLSGKQKKLAEKYILKQEVILQRLQLQFETIERNYNESSEVIEKLSKFKFDSIIDPDGTADLVRQISLSKHKQITNKLEDSLLALKFEIISTKASIKEIRKKFKMMEK